MSDYPRWDRIENCLKRYVERAWFQGREEWWVFGRLFALLVLAWLAACGWYCPASVVALFLALQIVVYNTAVVFVTEQITSKLRSVVLPMVGFTSLAVAFATLWIAASFSQTESPRQRFANAIYQSVRTITTAGPESRPGAALTAPEQALASIEMLLGIYVVAVIVARYLSLKPKGGIDGSTR